MTGSRQSTNTDKSAPDLRSYFKGSLDLYCEIDLKGHFLYVNDAWTVCLGYSTDELVGHHFGEFLHPEDLEPSLKTYVDPDPPEAGRFRNRYRHKDGHYLSLLWSGHGDNNRNVVYAHARDITLDRRQSYLLRQVASVQSAYLQHANDRASLFGQVLTEILAATESEFGFIGEIDVGASSAPHLSKAFAQSPVKAKDWLESHAEASIKEGREVLTNSLAKSGNSKITSFYSVPLEYLGERVGVVAVANRPGGYTADFVRRLKPLIEATSAVVGLFISSQRENAIRERFMVVVENLPILLTEFGPDARITWANRFYREKLGISETEIKDEDVLAESVGDPTGNLGEEERAREFMLSGRTDWQDFNLMDKRGHRFPSTWTNIRLKDGRAIGIGQDLTDRRAAEAKMIQSSKMASLGEMSAGVSHEINNPLAIIQGGAFRALENLSHVPPGGAKDKRDEVEADLNRIIQNCDRIARIVRGLRAFSRSAEHEPFIPTPLSSVVDDVMNFANERFKSENIEFHIDFRDYYVIDCRPVQMAQVLMNLLNNAFDAVTERDHNHRHIWVTAEQTGGKLLMSVEDSGPGISKSAQARIFEPFFTTKDIGLGTGLGLSISKGIIESHGGRLWLDSESKRTRFWIELPLKQPTTDTGLKDQKR